MNEDTSDFVKVMKNKRISPSDNGNEHNNTACVIQPKDNSWPRKEQDVQYCQ